MKSLRTHGSRFFGFALLGFLLLLATTAQAATFTVSNTNDSGAGSLRQAITSANMTAGLDTIVFSIPGGGVKTLTPASPLPTATQPLIIDGTSQPGFSGTPLIELNGTAAGAHANGLRLTAGTSWLKGLIINRFGRVGVVIEGPGQTTVSGCYIGTNAAGTADLGNGEEGVLILNSSLNTIGGTTVDRRNIISGNASAGISIETNLPAPTVSNNNIIRGNRIGTNAAGTAALPNWIGIRLTLGANSTLIGGTVAGAGNLISGNVNWGVYLGPGSNSHTIQGNLIGTDVTGGAKLGNGDHGIQCTSANNIIGGSSPAAGNVISGNLNSGLRLSQEGSGNQVKGNSFGSDKTGFQAVGNTNYGILIQEQTNNEIGGPLDGEGNIIAFNKKGGIRVVPGDVTPGATGNALLRNRIFANEFGLFTTALGIDLGPEGVTPNDLKDPDTGANNLQNFPLVTSVERDLSSTIFKGTINSKANTEYRIEFYRNQMCDVSGNGEGQFYVGAINSIITNVNGNANFNITMPLILLPIGEFVSATATDSAGNTSEFSPCTPIGAKNFGTFMVMTDVQFVNETAGLATVTLYRAGGTTGAVSMNYATSNVTATAPGDYTPKSGTLNFADGQASATVEIPIFNDGDPEGDEVIDLTFSNPTGSAAVGFIGPVHIHILDNDSNPDIIEFGASNYTVTENGVFLEVVVKKLGGNNSSVTFQASNGTATSPGDYTAPSGVITFSPFEFSRTVFVTILNDTMDEANETINLTLSNPDAAVLGPNSTAVITITDNDPQPSVSVGDATIVEGDSGTVNAIFPLTLSAASGLPINVNFATANGTAASGSDYEGQSNVQSFAPGETTKSISITVKGDPDSESDETFLVNLLTAENATIADGLGTGTIINDDSPAGPTLGFSQATYNVAEQLGAVTVTVTRSGDTTGPAAVDYTTTDTTATQKSDFEITSGSLNFAAGEVSKTVKILINQDMYIEGNEGFNVVLSNPTGVSLGTQSTTNVSITDDVPETLTNPIDDPQSFVHTHYHDFLNREPDAAGLQFWTNEIASCGGDAQCIEVKRNNVSAAFFLSIEFQQTGYLLYLIQKESFNSLPKYAAFMRDLQEISQGVVVNSPGWQQKLALNQQQFAEKWAGRPEFRAIYDGMSNAAFVNSLYTNAGVIPTDTERNALIVALDSATLNRGGVLLEVARNSNFTQLEKNSAFVLMQYFGYLRRDPDSGPDTDLSGFFFWLNKLNSFNGDYQAAEMVKAFLLSGEYRQRFGQ